MRILQQLAPLTVMLSLTAAGVLSAADNETARVFHSDDTQIYDCVQTADGDVWTVRNGSPMQIMARRGDRWEALTKLAGWSYRAMIADDAGCLWIVVKPSKGNYCLARWDTKTKTMLGQTDLPESVKDDCKLWKDLRGRIWLTGKGPDIYRFDEDGNCQLVLRLDDTRLVKPNYSPLYWSAQKLLFDPDGAIWLCSVSKSVNMRHLKGLARLDGPEPVFIDDIPGLPKGVWFDAALVTVSGAKEFWISVREGVFRVSADGARAEKLEFPDDLNKHPVWKIFVADGQVWLVNEQRQAPDTERAGTGLWGMDADGHWQRRVARLDARQYDFTHPWLATREGLWLGSDGNGLWFVPKEPAAAARQFSWPQGFPCPTVSGVFGTAGGGILAAQRYYGSASFKADEALTMTAGRVAAELVYQRDFAVTKTRDGEIFIYDRGARLLRRWTGGGWRDYSLPVLEGRKDSNSYGLALGSDSLNRVWLIPVKPEETAYVLDLDSGQWEPPMSYLEWLSASVKNADWHFLFQSSFAQQYSREAVADGHGRALLNLGKDGLRYYADGQWRVVKPEGSSVKAVALDDADDGFLLWLHNGKVLRMNSGGAVSATDKIFPPQQLTFGNWVAPKAGEEWRGSHGVRHAADDGWLFAKGNLWRVKGGRMAAWFADDEAQPFVRRSVSYMGVTEDRFGNYLFFNSGEITRVPRRAPSAVTLTVSHSDEESASVTVSGVEGGWVRARFGGGEWGEWQRETRLDYSRLAPADYRVEVEAMNKYLEVSPPAVVGFSIKYDVDKLTRAAAEKLFGENWDERNAAVKTLARFPEPARELLKKLAADRDRLSAADRWWLDAALQQVEGR
ncbi:MAG: hypothetical protein LBK76_06945 [Verrucomicrobiales bacterium]|jgi:hypothetical protein|nr:hypothetical protein [Verrucomicrobiales bacterium]